MPRDFERVLHDEWGGARVHGVEPAADDGSGDFRIRPTFVTGGRAPRYEDGIVRPFVRCPNVYDFAIRPPNPGLIMGGPRVEFLRGSAHPLLWMNAPRCALRFRAPPPDPIAAAVALWAVHAAATQDPNGGSWPTVSPLPAPGIVVEHLSAGEGYALHGPEPLVQGYARALRRLKISVECVATEPHGQYIPGGDGEMYDPPRPLKLLLLDQSYVIAETFLLDEEDVHTGPHHPA